MTVGAFISGHRDVALVVIFELTDMILCNTVFPRCANRAGGVGK